MNARRLLGPLWLLMLGLARPAHAQEADEWQTRKLQVAGVERLALLHFPAEAKSQPAPLVFIFHGHGGSAAQAARSFHVEKEWPEAICVYPQGLPTPGQLTDPKGESSGWQGLDEQGDRDLHFFDALLGEVRAELKVDPARIYATGHSNGGGFTYLLWLQRGELLAAVAPSSSAARFARRLPPKPALLIGGRHDEIVKFEWQAGMAELISQRNHCAAPGANLGKGSVRSTPPPPAPHW